MTLTELKQKFKSPEGQTIIILALVGLFGFQLGRITKSYNPEQSIRFESANIGEIFYGPGNETTLGQGSGNTKLSKTPQIVLKVIASKKSKSGVYHYLWCPGAKQIKPGNIIEFPSEQAAIDAGLQLAGNCNK